MPEAIGAAVSASSQRQEEYREKACVNCCFYEVSSGHCEVTGSNRDRYGTDAYSCPYYSWHMDFYTFLYFLSAFFYQMI